jgi:hypothetical protein
MPITVVDHDVPNQIVAIVTGEVGVSEILQFAAAERSGERRGWALIFDTSQAVVNVTAADIQNLAALAADDSSRSPIGPLLIIASTPAMFGLSRMYQSYASIAGRTNVRVCRSMEEAQRWLASPGERTGC